jgi:cyclopropane fatty-acyl-phospholipid synthase-like methyltransferase
VQIDTSAAAERNKQPILEELLQLLPGTGRVLEIAAGTGQHVAHFAPAFPGLRFLPTDPDSAGLATISTRRAQSGLANIEAPLMLDVLQDDWELAADFDTVLCINMIHISAPATTPALFAGAQRVLRPQGAGLVVLYGPFREDGVHTAASNSAFDDWLKSRDPHFGVRDLGEVSAIAAMYGFRRVRLSRLPANNLLVAFCRELSAP